MKKILYFMVFIAALTVSVQALGDEYYRRPGTGGYGINNEKMECPNCGKMISVTDSHMCRKTSSSSSSSSSSTGYYDGSSDVTDADIAALQAKYPDLLSNQTSFAPFNYSSMTGDGEDVDQESDYSSFGAIERAKEYSRRDKKFNTFLVIAGITAAGWWFYRRRRKA